MEKKVTPFTVRPFTSNSVRDLEKFVFIAETMVYQWLLNTYDGDITRVHAQIVSTSELVDSELEGHKEYNEYLRSEGLDFSINFNLELHPNVREEVKPEDVLDEL